MVGMKYKEIAEKYGTTINTVKSWKKRYGWNRKEGAPKKEKVCTQNRKSAPTVNPVFDDGTKETLNNENLTPEQQMFCIYYSRTFNATQSYLKAYGCTYDSAKAHGYDLLQKVAVKAEIERLKEIKRRQIVAGEDDIVELQMRIAFSDLGDYVTFGQESVPVMALYGPVQVENEETGKKEPLMQQINVVRLSESDQVDTQLLQEVKQGKNGVSVKLADRQKAIDWLTRYFLIHPDAKYKAEFDKKRAGMDSGKEQQIFENMQTIMDVLQHPVENRSIEEFEEVHEHE